MSEFSNFLEDAIINATLRGDNSDLPNNVTPYLALFSDDPTDAASGTEMNWIGYQRMPVVFDAPTNGYTQNTDPITFPPSDGNHNISHIGIYNAQTAGDMMYHTPLNSIKNLYDTDTITFNSGSIQITVA